MAENHKAYIYILGELCLVVGYIVMRLVEYLDKLLSLRNRMWNRTSPPGRYQLLNFTN